MIVRGFDHVNIETSGPACRPLDCVRREVRCKPVRQVRAAGSAGLDSGESR